MVQLPNGALTPKNQKQVEMKLRKRNKSKLTKAHLPIKNKWKRAVFLTLTVVCKVQRPFYGHINLWKRI